MTLGDDVGLRLPERVRASGRAGGVYTATSSSRFKILCVVAPSSPLPAVLRDERTVEVAATMLLVRNDGVEIPIVHSGAPIRGSNGEINGVVLILLFYHSNHHALNLEVLPCLSSFLILRGLQFPLKEAWFDHQRAYQEGLSLFHLVLHFLKFTFSNLQFQLLYYHIRPSNLESFLLKYLECCLAIQGNFDFLQFV